MTSLLQDTRYSLEAIQAHGHGPPLFCLMEDPETSEEFWFSFEDFERLADFEFDSGYGTAMVNESLVIVGDNWWMERGEYDGSEWWDFHTMPTKPEAHRVPQDLFSDWRRRNNP